MNSKEVNIEAITDTLDYVGSMELGASVEFEGDINISIQNAGGGQYRMVLKTNNEKQTLISKTALINEEEIEWIIKHVTARIDVDHSQKIEYPLNGWKFSDVTPSKSVYQWESKDGNVIQIRATSSGKFVLKTPGFSGIVSSKIPCDGGRNEISSYHSKLLIACVIEAVAIMKNHSARSVDRSMREKELAKKRFTDIPGVGDAKQKDLVETKNIYTYEDFNAVYISQNYRNSAVEFIQNKRDEGKSIKNDPYVKEVDEMY